jgi:hypothetical protein
MVTRWFAEKCLPCTLKHRAPNPPEICAFDFKGEFRQFGICSISSTIGIDWSIYEPSGKAASPASNKKDRRP